MKTRASFFFLKPPEVIGVHRIITIFPAVQDNDGRALCFIPAAADKPVAGHDPAHEKAVFFKGLACIGGTGRVHGAPVAVHRGYILLVKPDDRVLCLGRGKSVKPAQNREKKYETRLIPG